MKQYFLKLSAASLLLGLMAVSASAQQDESDKNKEKAEKSETKSREKKEKSDLIIVRTNDSKDAKLTIEVKDGAVTVNGKPLSEFKDDNVTITRRKQLEGTVNMAYSTSRFRNNSYGNGWSYNGEPLHTLGYAGGDRPFLGVTTEKEGDGAKILSIEDTSAAQKAGLKEGDIIIRVNDQKVISPESLTKAIGKYKPAEKVTVVYKREGKEQSKSIALGKKQEFTLSFNGPMNDDARRFGVLQAFNRGKLGIKAQETEEGKGVKVLEVDDESPADNAGIKEDDIITEFDGHEVNNVDQLRELAAQAAAKPSFKIKVLRDGKTEEITVKIPKNLKTTNL